MIDNFMNIFSEKIHVEVMINADIEKVWSYISNQESYANIPIAGESIIIKDGKTEKHGLGAIRKITGKYFDAEFIEEITRYDAPYRMDYLVLESTFPIKHEYGYIELSKESGKTKATWITKYTYDNINNIPFTGAALSGFTFLAGSLAFKQYLKWVKKQAENQDPFFRG